MLLIRYTRSTGDPAFRFDNYINDNGHSYLDKKELLKDYKVSLAASQSDHKLAKIPVSLQAGKTYSVSFKKYKSYQRGYRRD